MIRVDIPDQQPCRASTDLRVEIEEEAKMYFLPLNQSGVPVGVYHEPPNNLDIFNENK